jgi:hypothetical protein
MKLAKTRNNGVVNLARREKLKKKGIVPGSLKDILAMPKLKPLESEKLTPEQILSSMRNLHASDDDLDRCARYRGQWEVAARSASMKRGN